MAKKKSKQKKKTQDKSTAQKSTPQALTVNTPDTRQEIDDYISARPSANSTPTVYPPLPSQCSLETLCQLWTETLTTPRHNPQLLSQHFSNAFLQQFEHVCTQLNDLPEEQLAILMFHIILQDDDQKFEVILDAIDDRTLQRYIYSRHLPPHYELWARNIDLNITSLIGPLMSFAPRCTNSLFKKRPQGLESAPSSFEDRTQLFADYSANFMSDGAIIQALKQDNIDCANELLAVHDSPILGTALMQAVFDYMVRTHDAARENPQLKSKCIDLMAAIIEVEIELNDGLLGHAKLTEYFKIKTYMDAHPIIIDYLEDYLLQEALSYNRTTDFFFEANEELISIVHAKKGYDRYIYDVVTHNQDYPAKKSLETLTINSKKLQEGIPCNLTTDIIDIVIHTKSCDLQKLDDQTLIFLLSINLAGPEEDLTGYNMRLISVIISHLKQLTTPQVLRILKKQYKNAFCKIPSHKRHSQETFNLCDLLVRYADCAIIVDLFTHYPEAITLLNITDRTLVGPRGLQFIYSIAQQHLTQEQLIENRCQLDKLTQQAKRATLSYYQPQCTVELQPLNDEILASPKLSLYAKLKYLIPHSTPQNNLMRKFLATEHKREPKSLSFTLDLAVKTHDGAVITHLVNYFLDTDELPIQDFFTKNICDITIALCIDYNPQLADLAFRYTNIDFFFGTVAPTGSLLIKQLYLFLELDDEPMIIKTLTMLYQCLELIWCTLDYTDIISLLNLIERLVLAKPHIFIQMKTSIPKLILEALSDPNIFNILPHLNKLSRPMLLFIRSQINTLDINKKSFVLIDRAIAASKLTNPYQSLNLNQLSQAQPLSLAQFKLYQLALIKHISIDVSEEFIKTSIKKQEYHAALAIIDHHQLTDLASYELTSEQLTLCFIFAYSLKLVSLQQRIIDQPLALTTKLISFKNKPITLLSWISQHSTADQLTQPYLIIPQLKLNQTPAQYKLAELTANQAVICNGHATVYLALLNCLDKLTGNLITKIIDYFNTDNVFFQAEAATPLATLEILALLHQIKAQQQKPNHKINKTYDKYYQLIGASAKKVTPNLLTLIDDPLLNSFYLHLVPQAATTISLAQTLPLLCQQHDLKALRILVMRNPSSFNEIISIEAQSLTVCQYFCQQVLASETPAQECIAILSMLLKHLDISAFDIETLQATVIKADSLLYAYNTKSLVAFIERCELNTELCQLLLKHLGALDKSKLLDLLSAIPNKFLALLIEHAPETSFLYIAISDLISARKSESRSLIDFWHIQLQTLADKALKLECKINKRKAALLHNLNTCRDEAWPHMKDSFEKEIWAIAKVVEKLSFAEDQCREYSNIRQLDCDITSLSSRFRNMSEQLNLTLDCYYRRYIQSQYKQISDMETQIETNINAILDDADTISCHIETLSIIELEHQQQQIDTLLTSLNSTIKKLQLNHYHYTEHLQLLSQQQEFLHLSDHFDKTIPEVSLIPDNLAQELILKTSEIKRLEAEPPSSYSDSTASMVSPNSRASLNDSEPVETTSPILIRSTHQVRRPIAIALQPPLVVQQILQLRQQVACLTQVLAERRPVICHAVPIYQPVQICPQVAAYRSALFQAPALLEVHFQNIAIAAIDSKPNCFSITLPSLLCAFYIASDQQPRARAQHLWIESAALAADQPDIRHCLLAINPNNGALSIAGKSCHTAKVIANESLDYEQHSIVITHQFPNKSRAETILQSRVNHHFQPTQTIQAPN